MSYAEHLKNSKILDDVKSGSVVQANRKLVACSISPDINGNVVIPSTSTEILPHAFEGCSTLRTVTFEAPVNVAEIGDKAFAGTELEAITIPSSVYTLGNDLFLDTPLHSMVFEEPVHAEFSFEEHTLGGTQDVEISLPTSIDGVYTSTSGVNFQGGSNVNINIAQVVCPPKPVGAISTDGCGWMLPDNSPYSAMRDHISAYDEEPIKFNTCPQYTGYDFHFPITMVGVRRKRSDVNDITKNHNVIITFYNPGGPESFAQAEREYKAISVHLKVKSKRVTDGVATAYIKKYYKLLNADGDFITNDGYFFDVVMPAGMIKMDRVKKFKAVLKFHAKDSESYLASGSPPSTDGIIVASCGMAIRNKGKRGISAFSSFPYTTNMMHDTSSCTRNYEEQCMPLSAGNTVIFSTCGHFTNDPYLRLWRQADANHPLSQVYQNDDYCALGSRISYTVPSTGVYCLRMGCYGSGSCAYTVAYTLNGVAQV